MVVRDNTGVAYTPSWAMNGNPLGIGDTNDLPSTEPAGVTQPATPACPFGGRYVQCPSGHAGVNIFVVGDPGSASSHDVGDTVWFGHHFTRLFRQDALPASTEDFWGNSTGTAQVGIQRTSMGVLGINVDGLGSCFGSYATATNTDYFLDFWWIFDAPDGSSNLTNRYLVLRVFTLNAAGSPPTLQDTIPYYIPTAIGGGATTFANVMVGPSTGNTFGAHFTHTIENASSPLGMPRVMWYQPSANSALGNNTWTPNNFVNWQDVPPDDAVTVMTYTGGSGALNETVQIAAGAGFTAAQTPGAGDTIMGMSVIWRGIQKYNSGKGGTIDNYTMISESIGGGTSNLIKAVSGMHISTAQYSSHSDFFFQRANNTAWTQADVVATEIGGQSSGTNTSDQTLLTSVQAMVAWVKSGETLPAITGRTSALFPWSAPEVAPLPVKRSWVSPPMMIVAPVQPVTPQRRRFVWVS